MTRSCLGDNFPANGSSPAGVFRPAEHVFENYFGIPRHANALQSISSEIIAFIANFSVPETFLISVMRIARASLTKLEREIRADVRATRIGVRNQYGTGRRNVCMCFAIGAERGHVVRDCTYGANLMCSKCTLRTSIVADGKRAGLGAKINLAPRANDVLFARSGNFEID